VASGRSPAKTKVFAMKGKAIKSLYCVTVGNEIKIVSQTRKKCEKCINENGKDAKLWLQVGGAKQ